MNEVKQTNACTQESFLESFPEKEPELCECARFGRRALSWATWIEGFSSGGDGSYLDQHNLEFSHEHLFFDESGDNAGYGPHGIFVEKPSDWEYRMEDQCYNGSVMRRALASLGELKPYNFILNNCQDFATRVRDAYQGLIGSKG